MIIEFAIYVTEIQAKMQEIKIAMINIKVR